MTGRYNSSDEIRRQEDARVQALIERDRKDREAEAARAKAEAEVAGGMMANVQDTVVSPTPEWLAKGNVQTFYPKQPDGTVREIKTVRRNSSSVVVKMFMRGDLDDEQLQACLWYQRVHDIAGMDGRAAASGWSMTGGIQRSPGESGFGYVPSSEYIAEARDLYRGARNSITDFYLRFFEAVVVGNVPIRRATRFARCRNEKAPRRFRDCVQQVIQFCASRDVVFPKAEVES